MSNDHLSKWLNELCAFGAIRNNVFDAADILNNAAYLEKLLKREGFRVEVWDTPSGKPYVFAELISDANAPTFLFYSHFDGVPVDQTLWSSPAYSPIFKNSRGNTGSVLDALAHPGLYRLYGRSVADSKNAIISLLAALSSLRAGGVKPGINIKLLLDGEEELESPHLRTTVMDHREQLIADLVISASGETHQSGLPTIAFGVRGILMVDLILHTATTDMHSGHFGNFAPNAAFMLAKLLADMKDESGRVLIPGFYSGASPLTEAEKLAIRSVPRIEQEIMDQFGIRRQETAGTLQELINQPTFNVRGFQSGYVGEKASNIIPATAEAALDIRLVDGMDPDEIYSAFISYVRARGFHVTETVPTPEELRTHGPVLQLKRKGSFRATKTNMQAALPAKVWSVVEGSTDESWVAEPTEGGSLNFAVFRELG
ncbi:MAG TPA: M20/M25/M40 family metallo-hydrolase, partial [Sphingobacteriaceae bacterium]